MSRFSANVLGPLLVVTSVAAETAWAQSLDTPMTRLRPIGAPSAVDQYRAADPSRFNASYVAPSNPSAPSSVAGANPLTLVRETGYSPSDRHRAPTVYQPVRQAVMMQGFEAPTLPNSGVTNPTTGNGMALPSMGSNPNLGTTTVTPPPGTGTLPGMAPVPLDPNASLSAGDYAPMGAPQLGGGFATIDNCNCVTGPSSYVAASASSGCAPVGYQGPVGYQPVSNTYVAPPSQIAGVQPAGVGILPSGFPIQRTGIPGGPLISFGQNLNPVQVGQGILGQPVAYVPGQPVRNWIRYFFP